MILEKGGNTYMIINILCTWYTFACWKKTDKGESDRTGTVRAATVPVEKVDHVGAATATGARDPTRTQINYIKSCEQTGCEQYIEERGIKYGNQERLIPAELDFSLTT